MLDAAYDEAAGPGVNAVLPTPTFEVQPALAAACCTPTAKGNACC
jgi:hypothetical protein